VERWIVADVGGTNARLGVWQAGAGLVSAQARRYRNDDFSDLVALLDHYRADSDAAASQALLAVALPLDADGGAELRMTNRAWHFAPQRLCAALGLRRLRLVNDFAAAAAGSLTLQPAELTRIGGTEPRYGPRIVLGPGTGLGAAALLADADAIARVLPSEAGHMAAAPTDAVGIDALQRLRRHAARVSWERLLCGSGLAEFDAVVRGAANAADAADVAQRACAGEPAARRAVSAYAHALGEFAGDLCLALRATGGVYLVGGVLDGLADALDTAALRAGFDNKGRMGALLHAVPVYRVRATDLALRGLERMLSGAVHAPVLEARRGGETTEGAA